MRGGPSGEGDGRRGGLLGATRDQTSPDFDAAGPDQETFEDDVTALPHAIGRFVVLRRVGRGSMGEVYSAFDDELGRRVAIKLLRPQPRARESRRARMRREAQAMAQVSHPNVIQVFEAGEHGDRTFIAMEYVEGRTLEHWQRGSSHDPRSREQVLGAYLQAGAGLAAAHRAGVLHRDFKPSNVIIDAEGRVKVMDFGLAAWLRRAEQSGISQRVDLSTGEGGESLDSAEMPRLTREGTLLGTPAFMSPEQYLHQELDARSDQFSFCVAVWEALVGEHPFAGDSLEELRVGILKGQVRDGPGARALPSRLRRALVRGLAKNRGDRWPDMESLLEALRPRAGRGRWPWAVMAAGLAVAGLGYGVTKSRSGLCEGAPEQLARVWNDDRRAAAREGLVHTGAALAESTWSRAEQELDDYAGEWVAARQRVCEATHSHGHQSPELMDQRMACLDVRLHAMDGLLGTFESADLETVLRAVDASSRLPDVIECETTGVGALADAEATRPEALELRRRLAVALTHLEVGRRDDAHAELDAIHRDALEQGLPRLASEALVKRGLAEIDRGLIDQAEVTLETGLWAALARGHDEAAFEASLLHLRLVGVTLGDAERGRAGIARSEALLLRLGERPQAQLDWLLVVGEVRGRRGDYREARKELAEALELARQLHGPEDPQYAMTLNAAGAVALWGGDLDEAEQRFTELVQLNRRLYEPNHTKVAAALNNLAVVAANRGDLEAAEQRFREVLDVRLHALGEGHVDVGDAYMNLAGVAYQSGRPEEALMSLHKARAIYVATMDEVSAKRSDADLVQGMVLTTLGRTAEAEAILRDVLARQRKHLGERHPDLVNTLGALGRLLTRPADATEAVALLKTAVSIKREALESSGVPPEQDSALAGLEANLASAEAALRGEAPVADPLPPATPP